MSLRPFAAPAAMAALAMALAGCAQAPAARPAPDARALSTPDCPADARDLPPQALYGQWQAHIEGRPGVAVVRLHKHPDYNGVQGSVARSGQREAMLAGDIDSDGALSLDESQDGHAISANWSVRLRVGSCGKIFDGSWRDAADDSVHTAVLQKQ